MLSLYWIVSLSLLVTFSGNPDFSSIISAPVLYDRPTMSSQGSPSKVRNPLQTAEEAQLLFAKLQKRSEEVQTAFRLDGTIQCSTWLNFQPVLVETGVDGEPVRFCFLLLYVLG